MTNCSGARVWRELLVGVTGTSGGCDRYSSSERPHADTAEVGTMVSMIFVAE